MIIIYYDTVGLRFLEKKFAGADFLIWPKVFNFIEELYFTGFILIKLEIWRKYGN